MEVKLVTAIKVGFGLYLGFLLGVHTPSLVLALYDWSRHLKPLF